MSEQKTKSNAPWILGIVGLFLTILHYACAVVCAAALSAHEAVAKDAAAGDRMADAGVFYANFVAGIMLLCFLLSFFGKGKHSKFVGVLIVLGGITAGAMSCVNLSIPGLAAGFVYLFAGISSILNSKKIAA